ncbi:hypothetical protein EEB07_08920 [Bacillus velezensis]|nr:hypothetical protein EEB07_08920 [Bacillus velezensis]
MIIMNLKKPKLPSAQTEISAHCNLGFACLSVTILTRSYVNEEKMPTLSLCLFDYPFYVNR